MNSFRVAIFLLMVFFLPPTSGLGAEGKGKETKFQHEHRSSRIRYLNMRQQRYQNIVDTNIFKLATLYLEDREYDKALNVLRTVAGNSPDHKSRWTAFYVIGDIQRVEKENSAQAILAFHKVKGTLQPLANSALIDLYGKLGRDKDARSSALAALQRLEQQARKEKSPHVRENKLFKITQARAQIYIAHGEQEKAKNLYRVFMNSVQDKKLKSKTQQELQEF